MQDKMRMGVKYYDSKPLFIMVTRILSEVWMSVRLTGSLTSNTDMLPLPGVC